MNKMHLHLKEGGGGLRKEGRKEGPKATHRESEAVDLVLARCMDMDLKQSVLFSKPVELTTIARRFTKEQRAFSRRRNTVI